MAKDDICLMDEEITGSTKKDTAHKRIANLVLPAYTREVGGDGLDPSTFQDLLTDLMHYADVAGINFHETLSLAEYHFDCETGEGDEDAEDGPLDLAPGVTLDRQPLPTEIPDGQVALVLEIDNSYELHDSVTTFASVVVPAPPAKDSPEYEAWVWENILQLTGVGYTDGDSTYEVEVLESSSPELIPVGTEYSFG